jgi:nucleotide-binding universal stress UspA family protein
MICPYASLYVVNIVNPVPLLSASTGAMVFNVTRYQEELRSSAEKQLKELINEKVPDNVDVHPVISVGIEASEIVRVAENMNIDLLVIATHGKTGWEHFIFGSVAEKVVRSAKCPVVTIRAPKEET